MVPILLIQTLACIIRTFLSFYKDFDELLMHFCKILAQTIYTQQLVDVNFQGTSLLSTPPHQSLKQEHLPELAP